MPEFEPNEKTVRERAMEALVAVFTSQAAEEPEDDPYGFAWDQVLRSPNRGWWFKKQRSLGVFDGHENKVDKMNLKVCTLRVSLEIAIVIQAGENPSEEMNAVFGVVQRRLQEYYSLGGLVQDVQERQNDMQVQDENQRNVVGVMLLDMVYRHNLRDPRRIV